MKKIHKVASFEIPEKPVEIPSNSSPPSESKLRFVLSNFVHDIRFVYKPPSSANYVNPRKRLQNLSQPIDQDSEGSEPIADLASVNSVKPEKSPKNVTGFHGRSPFREASWPFTEVKDNTSAKPKEVVLMTSTTLPIIPVKKKKVLKMRELVRRKSCHCSDCGGLSKLEKKTLDIRPERKNRSRFDSFNDITGVGNTLNSLPRSASKSKKGGDARLRGVSVAAIMQMRRQDSTLVSAAQAIDNDTRSRTKTFMDVPNVLEMNKLESSFDKSIEPSTGRTLSGIQEIDKRENLVEKGPDEPENVPKILSKPSKFKTANFQTKKIQLRNLSLKKDAQGPQSSRSERSANLSSAVLKDVLMNKEIMTERKKERHSKRNEAEQAPPSSTDKVLALKSLLAKKRLEAKAVEIPPLDNVPEASCLDLYLKKVDRKESIKSLSYQRSSSVSKLSEGSTVVQRGVNNATKCYLGRRTKNEERHSIASSWVGQVRMEHMPNREIELSEKEIKTLRERKSRLNGMREDMSCEKILRSVRESLEREVNRKEDERKENAELEDRLDKMKNLMPMFLMNSRVRLSKSKESR